VQGFVKGLPKTHKNGQKQKIDFCEFLAKNIISQFNQPQGENYERRTRLN
jgi:hypothetical protein